MVSIWECPFIVVDVETNGSDPLRNRITEIACLKVQGGKIVEEFSSLVNPHQYIPPFIAQMTGISNQMAEEAPEVSSILPALRRLMPNDKTVFVAHNVRFDWSFIRHTFMRENKPLDELQQLCTYKLAKKILPTEMKKNVGSLANYFNINIKNRHRAYDDAKATALILLEFLEIAENDFGIHSIADLLLFQNKRNNVYKVNKTYLQKIEDKLEKLPDAPGVYSFLDKLNQTIYVGKAKSLKKKVGSYFNGKEKFSNINAEIIKSYDRVEWEVCDSELFASLREYELIQAFHPKFNLNEGKFNKFPYITISQSNTYPKLNLSYKRTNDEDTFYGPFKNYAIVEDIVKIIDRNFKLRKCGEDLNPEKEFPGCIFFQMNRCCSPCNLKQSREEYINEVEKVKRFLSGFSNGVIDDLEKEMLKSADILDFEKAQAIKEQIEELKAIYRYTSGFPTTILNNNLIAVTLNSYDEKTLDIHFIYQGDLKAFLTVGRKADLSEVYRLIRENYEGSEVNKEQGFDITPTLIDRIRVITYWVFKQQEKGKLIYTYNKNVEQVCDEVKNSIDTFDFYKNNEDNIDLYV